MATKNANSLQSTAHSKPTMAELMATSFTKPLKLERGGSVEGTVVLVGPNEIILDLGTKAEGLINKKDLAPSEREKIKIGDKLKAYVVVPENDSGQAILTLQKELSLGRNSAKNTAQLKKWQKFFQARDQKTALSGKVLEANKGGLLVEIEGARGFLPASQIGASSMSQGLDGLVGQTLKVFVIEADLENNRLIFSTRGQVSSEVKEKLKNFSTGLEVTGKVVAILPFGLALCVKDPSSSGRDLDGVEGVVFSQEIAWEENENWAEDFALDQGVKAKVLNIDENLGRVNLSLKQLSQDPFSKLAEQFSPDDVVTGVVTEITQLGINIKLEQGVDGFIPSNKLDSSSPYQIGQNTNFLIDSIDTGKRKINLTPFLTTTKGLIYK